MISCNGIAKLFFTVSASAFYNHVNLCQFKVDRQLHHWHTCLSYTKSFLARSTMKMNVQVFWTTFTPFQAKGIFRNPCSIIYTMNKVVFFKSFEGAV